MCDGGNASLRRAFAPGLEDLSGIDAADELEAACSTLFGVMSLSVGDEGLHGWTQVVLPMLRRRGTPQAAAVMCTIGALGGGEIEQSVEAELERLAADGIRPPAWVHALQSPVTAGDLRAYEDPDGSTWLLAGRLSRAGTKAGIVLAVDPEDCGALEDVWMVEGDAFVDVLARMRSLGQRTGAPLAEVTLDAMEWRWRAEAAMDAREVHDADDADDVVDVFEELSNAEGDGPGWRAMAAMLRFWIGQLPESGKPKPPHGDEGDGPLAKLRGMFAAGAYGNMASALAPYGPKRPAAIELPTRRKKSDGPAPVYRLRVDLRGAKPPIWRRLEVAGDTTLAELHRILQIAFGWDDCHMHCFETDFGTFGIPDPDLGHRAEQGATLEQVLAENGKMTYTYDFGDSWDHIITVESVTPLAEGVAYPRCTGGRRAAPPEDCGGIWGYEALCEILADPEDEQHAERLEWLGLDDASEFDPAAFDLAETDRLLCAGR
ncbi:plasmid pRiA4b ORF-3 family protein [Catenulispora rubra]|uniref:plasmid pRiA4b ORF-3 family protein n=1 Tax=Catenulispora rubra TaxID=280293 RepID=UPI002B277A46|nr:plasmid pRiA4b ORF-3 family protein [Catenulispora rubra]